MTISQEIVEIFENYLQNKGVSIPNEDRDKYGDEHSCILYGMDYADLVDNVEDTLQKWMQNDILPQVQNFLWKAVTEE